MVVVVVGGGGGGGGGLKIRCLKGLLDFFFIISEHLMGLERNNTLLP